MGGGAGGGGGEGRALRVKGSWAECFHSEGKVIVGENKHHGTLGGTWGRCSNFGYSKSGVLRFHCCLDANSTTHV